jgi:GH15 family glucan-1,4-alpha-glucosidase
MPPTAASGRRSTTTTETGRPDALPAHVLREYALIADGERGALCGPRGDITWLCSPRWHDDAVFSQMVGGSGLYAVTPRDTYVWAGSYDDGSLVWRHQWVTSDAVVECRDALAQPADPARVVVLRHVDARQGDLRVRVRLDLRARFGVDPMTDLHRDEHGVWTGRSGRVAFRWQGAADARLDPTGVLVMDLELPQGAGHDLVLEIAEAGTLRSAPLPDAATAWRATERWWGHAVPRFPSSATPRDTRQAYAVMRGLTSSTGAMVAAATTSLPERANARRNYDYRYAWIRDQCIAGIAVAADGPHPLLTSAAQFVGQALREHGLHLAPAYTVDGGTVPQEQLIDVAGYPGADELVRGNWVTDQFQLDTLGEALELFAACARHDALDEHGAAAARTAVDVMVQRWTEPDAGIWEIQPDWWAHSRLACVAGLQAAAAAGVGGRPDDLEHLAGTILDETRRRCAHPSGRWQRSPHHRDTDASLLLPVVRGATPADDRLHLGTLAEVLDRLSDDGYVYRYAVDGEPPGTAEGAFLLCGFIVALAELQQGDVTSAFRFFERNRSAAGSPGLLTEEVDVRQRQLRGNLPQAFVHALLLETSVRLGQLG